MTIDQFVSFLFKYSAPWYSDENPVLDAINTGFGYIASYVYGLLLYARLQTRIQTSTDVFLDYTCEDFFGDILERCPGESDADLLSSIEKLMLAQRVTRQNMINRLFDLTGRTPIIYEGFEDGGFYDHTFLDHTAFAGDSGPYQAWITAYRPTPLVTNTTAYLDNNCYEDAMSYYGAGGNAQNSCVTDQDILNTIEITKVAGTLMHVTILD